MKTRRYHASSRHQTGVLFFALILVERNNRHCVTTPSYARRVQRDVLSIITDLPLVPKAQSDDLSSRGSDPKLTASSNTKELGRPT